MLSRPGSTRRTICAGMNPQQKQYPRTECESKYVVKRKAMSFLAETVVEEWLNRQGYFTIRGIHLGVDEVDLLAIRPNADGTLQCRHIEVQASMRPVSYISRVPKEVQRATGRTANSVKRNEAELAVGVQEWVDKKFRNERKNQLRERLAPGPWTWALVIHMVKSQEEVNLIRNSSVEVLHLADIVRDLQNGTMTIASASGADLIDLMNGIFLGDGKAALRTDVPAGAIESGNS